MDLSNLDQALWYGLFLVEEDDFEGVLERDVEHKHITFGYRTEVPDGIDWDAEYEVELIGYANDGQNEGYEVFLPEELWGIYQGSDTPHMTVSTSVDGAPKDTATLEFEAIVPYTASFKFGYYACGRFYI